MAQFEKAELNDAAALSALAFLSKQYWGYPTEWMEHWREGLQITPAMIEQQEVFKLTSEQQIVGCIVIEAIGTGLEITHLWIHPDQIGQGYGKQLLHFALSKLTNQATNIRVEADPNAVPFYQKQGFKTIGKVESWPPGRFLPVMECQYIPEILLSSGQKN